MDVPYYESIGVHPLMNQFTQASVPEIGVIGARLPVVYEGSVTTGVDSFGISGQPGGSSNKHKTHINNIGGILGAIALVIGGVCAFKLLV